MADARREVARVPSQALADAGAAELRKAWKDYSVPRKQSVYRGLTREILIHPATRLSNMPDAQNAPPRVREGRSVHFPAVIAKSDENHSVDAGVAAVLGTAIGGGLAGLTGVGTSWLSLRTARLQLQSQESEAARRRRFESLQERRGPRSQAYADFIAAGQELIDSMYGEQEDFLTQFEALQANIRKRRSSVAIAGPDSVVQAAGEFADEVRKYRNELARGAIRGHPLHHKGRFERPLDGFAVAARTALEDEGHQS